MKAPGVENDSSLKGRLGSILKHLGTSTQGIDGATLVRRDGLIVSAWTPGLSDDAIAGAMSAALLNIGANVVNQLELGELKRVVVSGLIGDIVLSKATEEMILSVITRKGASLGMTFLELNRTKDMVSEIMAQNK
ncbi:MAG: roadblock/LC7 domain-containing protein [Promethearchaeati archaeon SRVP18_Atabeyarchaeia-1]